MNDSKLITLAYVKIFYELIGISKYESRFPNGSKKIKILITMLAINR